MKQAVQININQKGQILPQGIDLSDSFILNWRYKDAEFTIFLELSIWPESPFYEAPPKAYYTCYKKGELRFHSIKELKGYVDLALIKPSIEPDGSKDWEGIYDLRQEQYQITFSTDFTELEIDCEGFEVIIDE